MLLCSSFLSELCSTLRFGCLICGRGMSLSSRLASLDDFRSFWGQIQLNSWSLCKERSAKLISSSQSLTALWYLFLSLGYSWNIRGLIDEIFLRSFREQDCDDFYESSLSALMSISAYLSPFAPTAGPLPASSTFYIFSMGTSYPVSFWALSACSLGGFPYLCWYLERVSVSLLGLSCLGCAQMRQDSLSSWLSEYYLSQLGWSFWKGSLNLVTLSLTFLVELMCIRMGVLQADMRQKRYNLFIACLVYNCQDAVQTRRGTRPVLRTRQTPPHLPTPQKQRPYPHHLQGTVLPRQFKASTLNKFSIKPNPGLIKPGEEINVSVFVHRDIVENLENEQIQINYGTKEYSEHKNFGFLLENGSKNDQLNLTIMVEEKNNRVKRLEEEMENYRSTPVRKQPAKKSGSGLLKLALVGVLGLLLGFFSPLAIFG